MPQLEEWPILSRFSIQVTPILCQSTLVTCPAPPPNRPRPPTGVGWGMSYPREPMTTCPQLTQTSRVTLTAAADPGDRVCPQATAARPPGGPADPRVGAEAAGADCRQDEVGGPRGGHQSPLGPVRLLRPAAGRLRRTPGQSGYHGTVPQYWGTARRGASYPSLLGLRLTLIFLRLVFGR